MGLSPAQLAFVHAVRLEIERHAGLVIVADGAESFSLVIRDCGSGFEHTLFLDNAFREQREVPPEERPGRIARLLAMFERDVTQDAAWHAVRQHLMPVVRASSSFYLDGRVLDVLLRSCSCSENCAR